MRSNYSGKDLHIKVHWPSYLFRFAGLILSSLLVILGFQKESTALFAAGGLLLITFAILAVLTFWSIRKDRSLSNNQIIDYLYRLSSSRSSDTLAAVDLGARWPAISVSQHLTSGRMVVIDIYNPQLMPAKSLARARRLAPPRLFDPRLVWYDSNLQLMPMPDGSVTAVYLYFVLSEIAQKGDQLAVLKEIKRILEPNGRILMAEMANTWTNRLRPGSVTTSIHSLDYWAHLLNETGFEIRSSSSLKGSVFCLRADKPSLFAGQQMSLALGYERN